MRRQHGSIGRSEKKVHTAIGQCIVGLFGLLGCRAEGDAFENDASRDAGPADASVELDSSVPPLPPGCEAEANDLPAQGTADCVYAVESNEHLPDQRRPFIGRATVSSVTEAMIATPVFPGTTAVRREYALTFDFGFTATCMLIGTEAPWAEGDSLWLEANSGGWALNFEYAEIVGLFRRGAADAPFEVMIGGAVGSVGDEDTTADLTRLGLTLSRRPVCPYVPWPDIHEPERVGREMELTFTNEAGDDLALRRGEAGDIALPDGRRAHITLGMAREFQPGVDPDRPPMHSSFLLTVTP